MIRITYKFIYSILMFLFASTACIANNEFTLVNGYDVKVCKSYLNRLNQVLFENKSQPYCGRPEVKENNNFANLKRVYLSAQEIYKIYDRVISFKGTSNQMYAENIRKSSYLYPSKQKSINSIKHKQRLKRLYVWRYDPMVDIDNDGELDNVVIWDRRHKRSCGSVAYIFDKQTDFINESKTLEVFGHPNQIRPKIPKSKQFRFLNDESSVGVIKYKGKTYFDTFPGIGTANSKAGKNIDLRVYLRENNQTEIICEYHWNKK